MGTVFDVRAVVELLLIIFLCQPFDLGSFVRIPVIITNEGFCQKTNKN